MRMPTRDEMRTIPKQSRYVRLAAAYDQFARTIRRIAMAPDGSRRPYCRASRRHFPGVVPSTRRKVSVMWLWEAKPVA
ncbi:hypothetical protein KIN_36800 [Litoreibacter roseus]|uniref:Uncharacterized protein n=1 Tax=Litoreibacter roseus TaxID=2601869 RepID=A0A6N6JJX8_9RHOB|nr:hypothetical protein KIN_36800 [Litoreibacter roseus]